VSTTAAPASGPSSEPVWTIVFGLLLGGLGVLSHTGALGQYFGTGTSTGMTHWIPSIFGGLLVLLGVLALNPRFLKHAMHAAAMVGVLGLVGALVPLGIKASKDNWAERPEATRSEIAMILLCGAFVAMCVMSFRAARKRRKLREGG
jgi:uncharacterized membrane protein